MTTESEKKTAISGPPVVQRANALLDRVRMLGGEFSRSRYGLDRPFDITSAAPMTEHGTTIEYGARIGHGSDWDGERLTSR